MLSPWRLLPILALLAVRLAAQPEPALPAAQITPEEILRKLYAEALTHSPAYDHLSTLVSKFPKRLSGSPALAGAVAWGEHTLGALGLDRVYKQEVTVPHWQRGEPEAVMMLTPTGAELLSAVALGGSVPTPKNGLHGEVIEVKSLDELALLGNDKLAGKIVFFNRPMDPASINPHSAYSRAGDQRNRGPAAAAARGAAGALTRSLTHARDDLPHTGATAYKPEGPNIPAAALSPLGCGQTQRRAGRQHGRARHDEN